MLEGQLAESKKELNHQALKGQELGICVDFRLWFQLTFSPCVSAQYLNVKERVSDGLGICEVPICMVGVGKGP